MNFSNSYFQLNKFYFFAISSDKDENLKIYEKLPILFRCFKANGEDPIRTVAPFNSLLLMEIPQPWTEEQLLAAPNRVRQINQLALES